MSKVKKDTIEAKGFAIQIYTEDFKNDYKRILQDTKMCMNLKMLLKTG